MVPLTFMESGSLVEIVRFQCGGRCCRRLRELGVVIGSRYKLIAGTGRGPFILSDGSNRIGFGAGMAIKIIVREV